MIKRDFTVLVIAIVCGVAAFVLILNFLREAGQPKREFVIAAQAIPKDHLIAKRDLELSRPMKDTAPKDLFFQIEDVVGTRALKDIPKGKLIRRSNVERHVALAPTTSALPIPSGMKGLTISLRDVDQMPDLLDIGGYADLIGRVPNYEGEIEMKTVVRGAQVVSIERSENLEIRSITLALSPGEAEAVLGTLSLGKIRIVVGSEEGERPAYRVSWGTIDIIRGVNRQTKVTLGKGSAEEKAVS